MKYVIALFALVLAGSVMAATPHAQLSSDHDQIGGIVTFDNIDSLVGMEYEMYVGLTVVEDGLYLIVSAPQTGAGRGCVANWLEVNGEQVANSNILLCQPANQPLVGVAQTTLCMVEGDTLNTVIDGEIVAFFPEGQPTVPSLIFTTVKIGDC